MSDVLLPSAEMAYSTPDAQGFYGPYGGTFVPETVVPALTELAEAYRAAVADPAFVGELVYLLRDYVGRPSPLYRADRLAGAVAKVAGLCEPQVEWPRKPRSGGTAIRRQAEGESAGEISAYTGGETMT